MFAAVIGPLVGSPLIAFVMLVSTASLGGTPAKRSWMRSACSRGPASATCTKLTIIVAATNVHQTARWLWKANVVIECVLLVITIVPFVE